MPKDLVEGCRAISVREIPKDGTRRTTWAGFTLTTTTPRFGGLRYWFLCPRCGRRVGKLYHTEWWACRHCHNLAYQSQRRSNRLSKHPILRSLQLLDRLDAVVARYKAGDDAVLGKLLKLRDQMLQELARDQGEGRSTQTLSPISPAIECEIDRDGATQKRLDSAGEPVIEEVHRR